MTDSATPITPIPNQPASCHQHDERPNNQILVQVRDLKKRFPIKQGVFRRTVDQVMVVDGISFDIYKGETLSLVGENGSGKSTTGRCILQLETPTAGSVKFADRELTEMNKADLRQARRHMQMIFQNPYTSLNPRMTVGEIISEPLTIHSQGDDASRKARVRELLRVVGLNPYLANRYPHEFSGGQRQRVGVARALATNPAFIVADEPTSALDTCLQSQVVNMLNDLKHQLGLTCLFIARDLSVAGSISDRVAVMYRGRLVELGSRREVYDHPLHPYTRTLLAAAAMPDADQQANRQRSIPKEDVASPAKGCRFHPRCSFATPMCREVDPEFRNLGPSSAPHMVACHHAENIG